jgi:hypothetical protein
MFNINGKVFIEKEHLASEIKIWTHCFYVVTCKLCTIFVIRYYRFLNAAPDEENPLLFHFVAVRVTRWVCEKVAENIAQTVYCLNYFITLTVEKSSPPKVGYFCNFQLQSEVNNSRLGANFPNLVTLVAVMRSRADEKHSRIFKNEEAKKKYWVTFQAYPS